MMILNEEWMYVHIPKTSGVNFKTVVSKTYKKPFKIFAEIQDSIQVPKINELYWGNYNQEINNALGITADFRSCFADLVKTSPLFMWEEAEVYTDQKVFTIVRNPYTRLVSQYEDNLKSLKSVYTLDEIPSLEDYLFNPKFVKLSGNQGYSIAKRNQVEYLQNRNGEIICDRFYKMETHQKKLQRDFRLENIELIKYNSNEYNKNYSEIYTDKLINFVQTNFKKDFEYFEYDINPFW